MVPKCPAGWEVREHDITHTPPKLWCLYCAKATGSREPRPRIEKDVPDVEVAADKVPTISVDYMHLFGKGAKPSLVMIGHESSRVWAYALKDKSVLRGDGWIQRRIVRDIDNVGHKEIKIKSQSDQEPSIVAPQHEGQRLIARANQYPSAALLANQSAMAQLRMPLDASRTRCAHAGAV